MEEKLITENINLIYLVLKKCGVYHLLEDYYDIGMIGLVKAGKTYNKAKGYKFTTYACRCITNEVLIEKRKHSIPKRAGAEMSINSVIYSNGDNDITLEDTIPCDIEVEEEVIKKDEIERLHRAISKLKDKDRTLICSYYGIGTERRTQIEIAEAFEISQAQVCRDITKIIEKLKKGIEQ